MNPTPRPASLMLPKKEKMKTRHIKIKPLLVQSMILSSVLLAANYGHAQQVYANDGEWKETEVPAPPAFDVKKLVVFDVPTSRSLVYGIDPATVNVSKTDSLVRYVVVATSASGVRNVMYEGLRCSTGEFKTYARYSSDGKWSPVSNSEWRSVFDNMPSKHPLHLAKAGACDAAAPVGSVTELVSKLKNAGRYLDR